LIGAGDSLNLRAIPLKIKKDPIGPRPARGLTFVGHDDPDVNSVYVSAEFEASMLTNIEANQ
jgi:hypothetical protein